MATSLAVGGGACQQRLMPRAAISECLDSWKEIAAFFRRTTRTVQRWEMAENLPVHRHVHLKRSSVYALESELIIWRDARSHADDKSFLQESTSRRLRLAVLPFTNLSPTSQLRHFEDGLTYEIIAQLARLDPARLGVIARTSVMPYKKPHRTIAQIGRHLKVEYILEGSVGLAGRRMRIASHLIDVSDQTHVFVDTCARRWIDGLFLQIAFAERIARMVWEHLLAAPSANLQ